VDASLQAVSNGVQLGPCAAATPWERNDEAKHISTTGDLPCRKAEHGKSCRLCLDLFDGHTDGAVDAFDCKGPDGPQLRNQEWTVASGAGSSVILSPVAAPGMCLSVTDAPTPPSPFSGTVTVDPSAIGREYFGVGGLSNSDVQWLRDYPEAQRTAILDALFKPSFVAALQILKIEIGGDASSTIVTESSHMHVADPAKASFQRGWEWWLLDEAEARNPAIRTAALAWTAPAWLGDYYSNATVGYLVSFVRGAYVERGHRLDFLGLRNESPEPPAWFIVALREALDAAGFADVVLFGSDNHDFDILKVLASSPAATKALGIIGVHEPLRSAESVPAEATALEKPIWASEAYTTYSDSNGAGCWARVSNWGPVLGNVSAQIAWNLIQTYPSALGYDGHGLMWAERPWSGHFVVNPPLWASAHYTQFTQSGWRYLRGGSGTGLLQARPGPSVVTMVPPDREGVFASVVQAMTWNNSQCYRDEHPEYRVPPSQNVTIALQGALRSPVGGLQLWKSCFAPGDDPERPTRSVLFRRQSPDPVLSPDGEVTLAIDQDCVYTLASREPASQLASHGDVGPIPAAAPFPASYSSNLSVAVDGRPMYFLDQSGVFEGAALVGVDGPVLAQAVPERPLTWHSAKLPHPVTFVGPNRTLSLTVQADVRPASKAQGAGPGAFAGVGVGLVKSSRHDVAPGSLIAFANGTVCYAGDAVQCAAQPCSSSAEGWLTLRLSADAAGTTAAAFCNGVRVMSGLSLPAATGASFPGLVSSFDASAFRDLQLTEESR